MFYAPAETSPKTLTDFNIAFDQGDYSYSLGRWNTGETLISHCNATLKLQDINNPTSEDHARSVGCLSYLEGVKQLLYKQESFTQEKNICFPETGISNGQAARIVVNFSNEHPEKLLRSTNWILCLKHFPMRSLANELVSLNLFLYYKRRSDEFCFDHHGTRKYINCTTAWMQAVE